MVKVLDSLMGLLRRKRRPGAEAEKAALADGLGPFPQPDADGAAVAVAELGAHPGGEPLPEPPAPEAPGKAESVAEAAEAPHPAADAPGGLPAIRTASDLSFIVTGTPGMPGIDVIAVHEEVPGRAKERFAGAIFPADVRAGEYVLDVTGHALSFGPPGRTGAHVLVAVKTRKDTPASLPANAAGNALVPIDVGIVTRIDRETAASKGRLKRPPVVSIAFRHAAPAGAASAPPSPAGPGTSVPADDLDWTPDTDGPSPTPGNADDVARDGLPAMEPALAVQAVEGDAARAGRDGDAQDGRGAAPGNQDVEGADKDRSTIPPAGAFIDVPGAGSLGEWKPSGDSGR